MFTIMMVKPMMLTVIVIISTGMAKDPANIILAEVMI